VSLSIALLHWDTLFCVCAALRTARSLFPAFAFFGLTALPVVVCLLSPRSPRLPFNGHEQHRFLLSRIPPPAQLRDIAPFPLPTGGFCWIFAELSLHALRSP